MRVFYSSVLIFLIIIITAVNASSQDTAAAGMNMFGQEPVFGGVPTGEATKDVLSLSMSDAIDRGLKYNLAGIIGKERVIAAQGIQKRSRSLLLPNLEASLSESQHQTNLKAMGFGGFPGMPTVVGPFSVFDMRLFISQSVFNWKAINDNRTNIEKLKAEEESYQSIRDRIVFTCGALYLQAVTGKSRIDDARTQLQTARELSDLAADLEAAGVVSGIEVLRAQVEMQSRQQRLIVAENEFAQDKLTLARAIGLPLGQMFDLTDDLAYIALPHLTVEEVLERAYRDRSDYNGALTQVRAAESAKKAAQAGRLPSLYLNGNYGVNGPAPGQSHGSYALSANLRIPIFDGERVRAEVIEADAQLNQRRAEVEDLRAQIYYEVQTAFLNIKAADERVKVAVSSMKLAQEQLLQAQDRFSAGVAGNIEVVQAQEALANMTDSYISSVFGHNITKGKLAQSMGAAESSFLIFIRGN